MKKRTIETILKTALETFPVVLLNGSRQIGKSTLALNNFKNYLTFDDGELRLYAKENPKGFIKNLELPICLDEIQKVPSILEYIKIQIDTNRKNGNYLLTGSSNILDHKDSKDTLAGRLCELKLYPLSCKEKNDKANENIIEKLLNKDFKLAKKDYSENVIQNIIDGGYPEILNFKGLQKELWFKSYISTYIERDARDLADIRDIDSFIKFVNILSSRSGTILNKSSLSNDIGIKDITTDNYLSIITRIYQATLLKPYFANIGKQFIKSPKIFINDTGILCSLLKINSKEKLLDSPYSGQVYETFVFCELQKHLAYLGKNSEIYHYRTNDKKEIDFIIEVENKILAIEIKQSNSIKKDDFKHIVDFQNRIDKSCLGIVFYNGEMVIELSKNLVAIPFGFFL
ncbi:ATP-binding protein [Aliarcobacter butzleri]|uniref:ATP-binding protein n=1 Tax=Aliarcobacter butzleri TaxID=28197 RepID=UPI0012FA98A3|nr:ATP-binding protein [Aliarcobacter butzleri]MCG3656241.1 ATP-binding protein [Aliarcobacter butzleri]MCG3686598.1 ATP-binding protein [Aliarcobacter butzleri]MCT7565885.1 ATP-binding protein [Aliarcobacter butzleri]MCT7637539.1 ATP-binding protein [Aliarcobacter butzleri]MCT7648751.1 ATP-binding protein [Aliarcobacter butzleri]